MTEPNWDLPQVPCGSCPAMMVWVKTEKGKPMPIDPEPDPVRGRFRIVGQLVGEAPVVHYVKNSELEDNTKPLYASHFQTCPQAKEHRKSR